MVFRFYGKIATNPDNHNEETISALKKNAEGLSRISGERVWGELKKILCGNFAAEIVEKMINLGIGLHIGFPEKGNLDELHKLASHLKEKQIEVHVVTFLCAALVTEDQFLAFCQRCKLSNFETELGLFVIQNRDYQNEDNSIRFGDF